MTRVLTFDTNFIQALFQGFHVHHDIALGVLSENTGTIFTICPMVFCEALCIPQVTPAKLEAFLTELGIEVIWEMSPLIWHQAGLARAEHLQLRSKGENKRFIADFLIGAFADVNRYILCTFDPKGFRTAYPNLKLLP
jgi:predicted nucleic acid-binding protein